MEDAIAEADCQGIEEEKRADPMLRMSALNEFVVRVADGERQRQ